MQCSLPYMQRWQQSIEEERNRYINYAWKWAKMITFYWNCRTPIRVLYSCYIIFTNDLHPHQVNAVLVASDCDASLAHLKRKMTIDGSTWNFSEQIPLWFIRILSKQFTAIFSRSFISSENILIISLARRITIDQEYFEAKVSK